MRPSCELMVDLQMGSYKHTPPSYESMIDMQPWSLQKSTTRPNCESMADLELEPLQTFVPLVVSKWLTCNWSNYN